ncbi:proton channel OTOP2-like [Echeneis naucrates]|uniref:Proton channel OTOP2-like n=1 Tax=Echeneis naucrates TaxID=173247 RepID=A0A665TJA8_ECHNA|nr:proton channel OTOP2-like [Echeneis naucrates]
MCLNTGHPCNCLTEGNPCEPCRTIAKDSETEEVHLSNNINTPSEVENTSEPNLNNSSTGTARESSRNWGWIVSGIICVNVLLLGTALASGSAHYDVNIKTSHVQMYLIILLLLTMIWMIAYIIYTTRNKNAVVYHDTHAGPIWLRGGLVLFGVLSIIMDIFKIASYVGYLHCESAVKVAFPVVQLAFLIVQTYFFCIHSKDCVQLQKNIARCGLMLTLSTNLVVWMTAVTEESVHQTQVPDDHDDNTTKLFGRNLYITKASYGDDKCKCSHTSCSFFKEAYYYLYPFNIEYSLFASAMAYVMWKNVSRVASEHSHHKFKFNPRDAYLGPIMGVFLVVAGLATFVVYEMEMKKNHNDYKREKAVMMHFAMNIVIVTTMSISTLIGFAIYRVDHREHVSEKNPTRSLDVGLLVGASLGQFIISYFTIVAMVGSGAEGYLNRLNLAWAILMVIQLGLQNLFIIEGLHREPFHEVHPVTVVANAYISQPGKEPSSADGSNTGTKPIPVSMEHNLHGHGAECRPKLTWKRRALKEVSAFLLMGNIILWIMPAFGARPQFDHDTETNFYNFNMWAAVVNVGLPFGIFYRMHSVASLFEVFLTS